MEPKRKLNNCQACERNDSYDDMVCCGNCEDWYHFKCAGVGRRITRFDWFCPKCLKIFTETYQSARAAEDSIVRNLEVQKINGNINKRSRHVEDEISRQRVTVYLEEDKLVKMIEQTVASAIAKHFEANVGANIENVIAEGNIIPSVELNIETVNAEANIETANSEGNIEGAVVEANLEAGVDRPNIEVAVVGPNIETAVEIADVEAIASYLPVQEGEDSLLKKLDNDLGDNMEHFRQEFKKNGAEKLSTTMRIIGNKIVDDGLLKDYSYTGKGSGNKDFSKYTNIKELVCLSTMDAYNNYNNKQVTLDEVIVHFCTRYVRFAKQRYQRNLKKK